MMAARIYHKTSKGSLTSIQKEGLLYGATNENNQEPPVRKANETLDRLRPAHLVEQRVSRKDCLYCYLVLDGRLLDVDTGKAILLERWDPGEDNTGLLLEVDPPTAYVSDLEAYDQLAGALERQAPDDTIKSLAEQYWLRLLPLPEMLERYRLDGDILVPVDGNGTQYGRVEVMLAASVPPEDIIALGS